LGKLPEFYVDADLCTECGDCITAMPDIFNANVDDSKKADVEKMMNDCPAAAILWKK
jgi:ferredoxin